jgi:hypothetical protein
MLAIPLMRCEGNLDYGNLERILRSQNSGAQEQIVGDCKLFDDLRRAVTAPIRIPTDESQQLLLQYYYQVKSLSSRFQSIEKKLKFGFTWNDAFVRGRKCTMLLFSFELACVLWNLAACESIMGSQMDRSTPDGFDQAESHFKQAAGYFEQLEKSVPELETCTLYCLSPECFKMLKFLTLSEAQLCVYEKAVRDKKADPGSVECAYIARLAAYTSILYSQAALAARSGPLGRILDNSWSAVTDFQAKCFHGIAHYWQAIELKESFKAGQSRKTPLESYAEEMLRYHRAEGYIHEGVDSGRRCNLYNLLPSLLAGANDLLATIELSRREAQETHKDLTLPMERPKLQEITGEVKAVPRPVPDQSTVFPSLDCLLFKFIEPKKNAHFFETVGNMYNSIQAICDNATNAAKSTLSSFGLPESLESVKSIPAPLWTDIVKLQKMGGIDGLKKMAQELTKLSTAAGKTIETIQNTIKDDEDKDNVFWEANPEFTGTRSSTLNEDMKKRLKLFHDAYENALCNDEIIQRELTEHCIEGKLLLLLKNKDQLMKTFHGGCLISSSGATASIAAKTTSYSGPSWAEKRALGVGSSGERGGGGGIDLLGPDGRKIEEKLHKLAELFDARLKLVNKIKSFQTMNITDEVNRVALSNGGNINSVYDRYMNEIRQCKTQIDDTLTKQDELIRGIVKLNESFNRAKEANPLLEEKKKFIDNLEEMVELYTRLYTQVAAGQTFYINLQSKLSVLQQNVDDLAYTQQWLRQGFGMNMVGDEQIQKEIEDASKDPRLSYPTRGGPSMLSAAASASNYAIDARATGGGSGGDASSGPAASVSAIRQRLEREQKEKERQRQLQQQREAALKQQRGEDDDEEDYESGSDSGSGSESDYSGESDEEEEEEGGDAASEYEEVEVEEEIEEEVPDEEYGSAGFEENKSSSDPHQSAAIAASGATHPQSIKKTKSWFAAMNPFGRKGSKQQLQQQQDQQPSSKSSSLPPPTPATTTTKQSHTKLVKKTVKKMIKVRKDTGEPMKEKKEKKPKKHHHQKKQQPTGPAKKWATVQTFADQRNKPIPAPDARAVINEDDEDQGGDDGDNFLKRYLKKHKNGESDSEDESGSESESDEDEEDNSRPKHNNKPGKLSVGKDEDDSTPKAADSDKKNKGGRKKDDDEDPDMFLSRYLTEIQVKTEKGEIAPVDLSKIVIPDAPPEPVVAPPPKPKKKAEAPKPSVQEEEEAAPAPVLEEQSSHHDDKENVPAKDNNSNDDDDGGPSFLKEIQGFGKKKKNQPPPPPPPPPPPAAKAAPVAAPDSAPEAEAEAEDDGPSFLKEIQNLKKKKPAVGKRHSFHFIFIFIFVSDIAILVLFSLVS